MRLRGTPLVVPSRAAGGMAELARRLPQPTSSSWAAARAATRSCWWDAPAQARRSSSSRCVFLCCGNPCGRVGLGSARRHVGAPRCDARRGSFKTATSATRTRLSSSTRHALCPWAARFPRRVAPAAIHHRASDDVARRQPLEFVDLPGNLRNRELDMPVHLAQSRGVVRSLAAPVATARARGL